ncbi:hypothetical protein HOLleu_05017 [Holothuria leucospilota]|uniref:Uncharacterized protein n=1 Tax=Holothuria leucospilota TaxID=206669 RepID=A0A9Q1CJF5_HOLLE|nr:hypothetical protein HOLleu_05017 [Holothuria leucospilota]
MSGFFFKDSDVVNMQATVKVENDEFLEQTTEDSIAIVIKMEDSDAVDEGVLIYEWCFVSFCFYMPANGGK